MPPKPPSSSTTPSKPTTATNITTKLLSRAHSPSTTQRLLADKLHPQRPLHLKPTDALSSSTPITNARHARRTAREAAKRRRKKLKPKPLSAREKRAMCIYELSEAEKRYAVFEPLHALWVVYMQELLQLRPPLPSKSASTAHTPTSNKTTRARTPAGWPHANDPAASPATTATVAPGALAANMVPRLVSADFHGAKLQVVRSRCVSRVGVGGIVVRDSKFTFEVVTSGDTVRVLPKEHSVFRFEVPWPDGDSGGGGGGGGNGRDGNEDEEGERRGEGNGNGNGTAGGELVGRRNLVFELHGDQFQYRAVDRANKKFKTHFLPDL